jgi:hypothetical protein
MLGGQYDGKTIVRGPDVPEISLKERNALVRAEPVAQTLERNDNIPRAESFASLVQSTTANWYNKLSLSSKLPESTLDVRFPFTLSEKGLLRMLFDGADAIYSELDRLQDSGFAIGYDILPDDMPLFDGSFNSAFSGTIHLIGG